MAKRYKKDIGQIGDLSNPRKSQMRLSISAEMNLVMFLARSYRSTAELQRPGLRIRTKFRTEKFLRRAQACKSFQNTILISIRASGHLRVLAYRFFEAHLCFELLIVEELVRELWISVL